MLACLVFAAAIVTLTAVGVIAAIVYNMLRREEPEDLLVGEDDGTRVLDYRGGVQSALRGGAVVHPQGTAEDEPTGESVHESEPSRPA